MKLRGPFLSLVVFTLCFVCLVGNCVQTGQAMTTEEEKKLGKSILDEMLKKLDVVRDLPVQTFINRMGRTLVAQVEPTPYLFEFFVIKAAEPNAFAIPGGAIFVTTGLITLAENESELAGVLSHEISHVTARHIAQMVERSKRINIVTLAAMIAAAIAGRGGKGSEAGTVLAMATGEALMLKYTRENEVDADQNALNLMTKTGYDSQALITFLKKMERQSLAMTPRIPQYLLTHPALDARVSLLENLLLVETKPAPSFQGEGNYKRVQNRVFVEERDPSAAVSHFDAQVKAHPEDPDARFGLGLAYQAAGRMDKSIEVFQSASADYPEDAEFLRELGIAYFLSGKLDQAVETLERASQNKDLKSIYYLGKSYQEKGRTDRALTAFQQVQKGAPDYPEIYFNLGSAYGRVGLQGFSHLSYGRYFELRRDKKTALLHYRKALEFLEAGSPERVEARRKVNEFSSAK